MPPPCRPLRPHRKWRTAVRYGPSRSRQPAFRPGPSRGGSGDALRAKLGNGLADGDEAHRSAALEERQQLLEPRHQPLDVLGGAAERTQPGPHAGAMPECVEKGQAALDQRASQSVQVPDLMDLRTEDHGPRHVETCRNTRQVHAPAGVPAELGLDTGPRGTAPYAMSAQYNLLHKHS